MELGPTIRYMLQHNTASFTKICFFFFFLCVTFLYCRSFPSFQAVNQVIHVLFLCLPFLWIIGLLPPIDAFFLWIAEQVLVFGLGGSPCATDIR